MKSSGSTLSDQEEKQRNEQQNNQSNQQQQTNMQLQLQPHYHQQAGLLEQENENISYHTSFEPQDIYVIIDRDKMCKLSQCHLSELHDGQRKISACATQITKQGYHAELFHQEVAVYKPLENLNSNMKLIERDVREALRHSSQHEHHRQRSSLVNSNSLLPDILLYYKNKDTFLWRSCYDREFGERVLNFRGFVLTKVYTRYERSKLQDLVVEN